MNAFVTTMLFLLMSDVAARWYWVATGRLPQRTIAGETFNLVVNTVLLVWCGNLLFWRIGL